MKKSFELLTILLFPFIISCRPESVGDRDGGDTVIIRADFSGAGKKSALVEDELAIRNVCVAVYRGGLLFKSYYTDGNAVDMELFHGDVYNLSAVANCGRCTFPMMETDLASMRVACSADAAGGEFTLTVTDEDGEELACAVSELTLAPAWFSRNMRWLADPARAATTVFAGPAPSTVTPRVSAIWPAVRCVPSDMVMTAVFNA